MKKTYARILLIVVYLMTIALTLFCIWRGIAICGDNLTFNPPYFIAGTVGFLLSWLFTPILHEIGHLAFAQTNGFECYNFSIWFVHFYHLGDKLKVKVGKDNGVAGSCDMIPMYSGNMKKRFYSVTSGGILVTGIFFALLVLFLFLSFWLRGVNILYFFIVMFLPSAFFYTFFNLIPFENENGKSDGAVLFGIRNKNASVLTTINILRIQAELNENIRFADIPERYFFSAPQLMESDPNFALILQMRYYYYQDKNDQESVKEVVERLESIFDDLPLALKQEIAVDLFYEAVVAKQDDKVKKYYKVCKELQDGENYLAYKVLACRYAYKGRSEESDEYCMQAVKQLSTEPFRGRMITERILLGQLREQPLQK